MLPSSNGGGSSGGGGSLNARHRHRRRRRSTVATPRAAPPTSASTTALAACLAALIFSTTGDSPPSLANAFLVGWDGSSRPRPSCFLHAATAAANGGGSSIRTRKGLGGSRGGATSLPGCSVGATGSTRNGPLARRRACSRVAAWGAGGGGVGSPWSPGRTRAEKVASLSGGFGCEEASRGGGGACLRMTATGGHDGAGAGAGGGGDACGIRATGTTKAAAAAAAAAAGPQDLATMRLSELKVLYRKGGGKPGNMRKAELVERLSKWTAAGALMLSPEEEGEAAAAAAATAAPTVISSAARNTATTGERRVASEGASNVPAVPPQEALEQSTGALDLSGVLNGVGAIFADENAADTAATQPRAPPLPPAREERFVPDASFSSSAAAQPPVADLLSSGPSAVVAAARARGAAAAAASSKVAASGRLRAMTEARRHAEAVRARASSNSNSAAWAQSAAEAGQQQQPRGESTGVSATATLVGGGGGGRGGGVREVVMGAKGLEGLHNGVKTAAPGAAAVAAVASSEAARAAAAAAAAAAATAAATASKSPSIGRSGGNDKPERRREAGATGKGGGGRGADGGAWSVLVAEPVARRSPREKRGRRLPVAYNPWARGGAGGEEEGMPEEGDVVDAFLADAMMRSSDDREASGDPVFDRENRFQISSAGSPVQLTFLGTASCIPSTSRGVSCTVLRNKGDLWLFDVGEGTQIQIQRSNLKPTRITKIFITHAHGDHSFGLPGILCLMGTNFDRTDSRRVEIYGPTGLRAYLRAAIQYTHSKAVCPYVVHELSNVPYLHGDFSQQPEPFHVDIARDNRYGEQYGGRNFYPDKNGHFELFRDDKCTVRAAPMKHGVPCVGFVVEEADRPGRLLAEKLTPILKEHKETIIETTGRGEVGWILGWIKSRKDETITLPGTNVTINCGDYVGETVKGRKVVILGDTCDAGSMVPLAMGADVVVHEATNTWLPPLDQGKTYADVESEAINHGHSTPVMAAAFAKKVGARTLILNHFSARYRGDPSDASVAAMMRIERQAARAGGFERHQVVASWDLLELPVVDADQWESDRATAREADAVFDAELLRRAQQWREESGGSSSDSVTAAAANVAAGTGAASPPPRAYERERSRDVFDGAEVDAPGGALEETEQIAQEADAVGGSGASRLHRGGAAEANGSTTAANAAGLVGIFFDAMA